MGQYRARNPVFRPQRALYEPAVSRRRTRGAAGAGRLRDELGSRPMQRRCISAARGLRSASSAAARASTAPICTRSFTVCCAIRRKCAAATAISGRSRATLRSKACSTVWITAASRRTKTSVRRRSLYRSLHKHMPVLTAEAVYRHFRRERMNSYDCATLTRVFASRAHALARG